MITSSCRADSGCQAAMRIFCLATTPRHTQAPTSHSSSASQLMGCVSTDRYQLKNAEARLHEKETACSALQVRNEELKMQLDTLEIDQSHRASIKLLTLTKQHELLQEETEELHTKASSFLAVASASVQSIFHSTVSYR